MHAAAVDAAKEAVDAEKVQELEALIQQRTEELQEANERSLATFDFNNVYNQTRTEATVCCL